MAFFIACVSSGLFIQTVGVWQFRESFAAVALVANGSFIHCLRHVRSSQTAVSFIACVTSVHRETALPFIAQARPFIENGTCAHRMRRPRPFACTTSAHPSARIHAALTSCANFDAIGVSTLLLRQLRGLETWLVIHR